MAGMMGPAVLITLGILFLVDQMHYSWQWGFGRTWPVLLVVIGIVKVLKYTAPTEGHVPRGYYPAPIVTPPPVPPAGSLTGSNPSGNQEERHV